MPLTYRLLTLFISKKGGTDMKKGIRISTQSELLEFARELEIREGKGEGRRIINFEAYRKDINLKKLYNAYEDYQSSLMYN